ncbi:MAG: hypothetical protein ABFD77_01765 [Thermotogota bacterium]
MTGGPAGLLRVCLVNGSLRGPKASSNHFLACLERFLDPAKIEVAHLAVRAKLPNGYPEETLARLSAADAVVLAFPLFSYCLPGATIRLLEEWAHYADAHPAAKHTRVYVLVNCGYADPKVNDEAIHVVRNFCARLGLEWRFAIEIGCGPAVLMLAPIDLRLRRALQSMAADLQTTAPEAKDNVYLWPLLPRILMDTIRQSLDRKALREAIRRQSGA